MYKNIEILDKKKLKNLKFETVSPFEVGKTMEILPLGFNELLETTFDFPVIIMGEKDNLEFVAFGGISPKVSGFNNETVYTPVFTKTYPFLNVILKDKKGELKSVIGIDKGEFCGTKKENTIFKSDGTLEEIASQKIEMVRELNRQRGISKKILKELVENDLLIKKNFSINDGKNTRVILDNFYVVNREKLFTLDDAILLLWAKKGWLTIFDMHLKSLGNFKKIFEITE